MISEPKLDAVLPEIDNDFFAPLPGDEGLCMTRSSEDRRVQKLNLWISAGMLILVTAGLGYTIWHDWNAGRSVDVRLTAIETGLRILTQTVAPQLYKSMDDSIKNALIQKDFDAAKSLENAQADIKQLQDSHVAADPAQLEKSATALADVTIAHPNLREGWSTSARLISYRSPTAGHQPIANLGNCLERPWSNIFRHNGEYPPGATVGYTAWYHDCTLVIDDESDFEKGPAYAEYLTMRSKVSGPTAIALFLERVHVVYRGGNPINAAEILFKDCTFEFQVLDSVPPDSGKQLMRGLLYADLSKPAQIKIASGM